MIRLCYYLEYQTKECGCDSAYREEPLEAFMQEKDTEMTTIGRMDCDDKDTLDKNIFATRSLG